MGTKRIEGLRALDPFKANWVSDHQPSKRGRILCPVGQRRRHPIGMQVLTRSEVFEQHGVELTLFATSLVGPDDAQDVVADALMRSMWSKGWSKVENQRAYLYRAVLSQARMNHRSDDRRKRRERAVALPMVAGPVVGEADVWDILNCLSLPERSVVFLKYWDDLTDTETAKRLGVSDRTVRRRLVTARHKLRRALNE